MKTEDLAYMAAVVDLRGLQIYKKNQQRATPQVVMAVDSRHFNIIERLSQMTGVNPENKRTMRVKEEWLRRNCVEHCPEAHTHTEAPNMPETRRWSMTGISAAIVLHNILPYMANAGAWKEFQQDAMENIRLTGQGAKAVRTSMARLVSLGWALPPEIAEMVLEMAEVIKTQEGGKDELAVIAG